MTKGMEALIERLPVEGVERARQTPWVWNIMRQAAGLIDAVPVMPETMLTSRNPWEQTKNTIAYNDWNWLLCRRADLAGRLWPGNREDLYLSGATIDEAMQRTYPEWRP